MTIKYTRWLRSYVGHQRIMQVRSCGFVQDAQGGILLCRRADVMLWDLPGGTIGLDETPVQGLTREVQEETGLLLAAERLIGVYAGPDFHWTYPNGDQAQILALLFGSRIVEGELRRTGHENVNIGFFSPDQLPPLIARTRRMIADAMSGRSEAAFS